MVLGRPSLVRGSSSDKGHNFTNMITNLGIHHIGEIMSFFILSILRIKNTLYILFDNIESIFYYKYT